MVPAGNLPIRSSVKIPRNFYYSINHGNLRSCNVSLPDGQVTTLIGPIPKWGLHQSPCYRFFPFWDVVEMSVIGKIRKTVGRWTWLVVSDHLTDTARLLLSCVAASFVLLATCNCQQYVSSKLCDITCNICIEGWHK